MKPPWLEHIGNSIQSFTAARGRKWLCFRSDCKKAAEINKRENVDWKARSTENIRENRGKLHMGSTTGPRSTSRCEFDLSSNSEAMAEKKAQMDKDSVETFAYGRITCANCSVELDELVHILSLHVEFSARISTTWWTTWVAWAKLRLAP